jgi:hypothetical protein
LNWDEHDILSRRSGRKSQRNYEKRLSMENRQERKEGK